MLSKLQTVKSLICLIEKLYAKLSLRSVLIMPFVLQTCGCVGIVGYLAHQQGQKLVTEFATQLENEICDRIEQYLNNYLTTPEKINQINADAIRLGLLNLSDLETTEHYFWKQQQVFNIGYHKFANPKDKFVSIDRPYNHHFLPKKNSAKNHINQLYVHTTNKQRNPRRFSKFPADNPRLKLWYMDAVDIAKPVWSQIYQSEDQPEVLSISSNYPVYDRTNKLIGVIGIDLLLSQISSFLTNLKVGKSGKTFILERSGLIVASSTTEPPCTTVKGQAKRLLASDSQDSVVRLTTQYLLKRFGSLRFLVDQQKLVTVHRIYLATAKNRYTQMVN
jgi:hypothetical protein